MISAAATRARAKLHLDKHTAEIIGDTSDRHPDNIGGAVVLLGNASDEVSDSELPEFPDVTPPKTPKKYYELHTGAAAEQFSRGLAFYR
jgi:hypothetical protein